MALTIAIIIVSGLAAFVTLPRTEDPRISNRITLVVTPFPGASSERVEALLTEPLENKLRELSELDEITSTSKAGISVIRLKLKDEVEGVETPLVWSHARDLIAEVAPNLPVGAGTPELNDDIGYAYTMLISMEWQGDSEPQYDILGRYAKELESRLRAVYGTELVNIVGQPEEEILVEFEGQRLSSIGLTSKNISDAVRQADAKIAAGQLRGDHSRIAIEVAGELSDLERIRRIPLKVGENGEELRIGDVAKVLRQERTPARNLAIVDDHRVVVVAARMLPNMRVDHWTQSVNNKLDQFRENLPTNVVAHVIFNQDDYTQARLGGLTNNIVLGFIIILAVLFITLGWRSALIVASALPLTVFFSLSIMNFYGLSIHQMSVTGLVVALGIMVDNAIVMTDSIAHERNTGHSRLEAVLRSVKHLWLPLLGSTLTTILAFMPIVLMPGPAGEFVGGVALSVIFSLIGSYVISHTIIAGLAGRFLKREATDSKRSHWLRSGVAFPIITDLFQRSLRLALRRPLITALIMMAIPITGFKLAGTITEQFFPTSDRDMFHIELYMPQHTSLKATQRVTEQISERLKTEKEIKSVSWFVGANAPSFYYNLFSGKEGSNFYAQAMVSTTDFESTNRLIPKLQFELDEEFLGAQILVRKLIQGPPVIAPVEIRIVGPSLQTLRAEGDRLKRLVLETQHIVHARATLAEATPKIWLHIDEELSQQSGLPLTALANQLQQSIDGIAQGTLVEDTQSLPVRIRFPESERQQMSDLEAINFVSSRRLSENGFNGIPLSAIGELELVPVRGTIPRRNGERVNTIEAFSREGVLPAVVLTDIKQQLADSGYTVPSGYRLEIGGEGEARDQAVSKLKSSLGIIVTLLVLVVVLSFNSFRISGIIFTVTFLSAGTGIFSLYLSGFAFGFNVIIALMGLIGLAINAAIVILAEFKANPAAVTGDKQAIIDCVMLCARHISSTTITTIGGFIPLMLAGGGFWPPFAITIAGGTLLATLVSFYFVPAVFSIMAKKRAFEVVEQGATNSELPAA